MAADPGAYAPPCASCGAPYSAHVNGRCPPRAATGQPGPAAQGQARAQPGSVPPAGQPNVAAAPQQGNGLAIASLVLGIVSVIFSWWGLLTLAMVVLAITFGGISIHRAEQQPGRGRGMAIAGLVLGIVGFCLYFVLGVVSVGVGFII